MLSERVEYWVQMSHDVGTWSDFSETNKDDAERDFEKLIEVCDARFDFRAIKRTTVTTITEEVL